MGILPTPDDVRSFLNDKNADKRAKLIDRVLERPEFVDFWTMQMNDLLMNRKESDHDVRGPKGVRGFHEWIRQQVAQNRPWNEMTRELLTVTGTTHDHPAVGYYIVNVGEESRIAQVHCRRQCRPDVPRRPHRLRPVPQSSAGEIHAGRLLPFRRLLGHSLRPQGPEDGSDDV